jgi:hypothetical protein
VVIDGVAAARKGRRRRRKRRSCGKSSRSSERRGGAVAIAKVDCTGRSGRNASGKISYQLT